MILLVTHARDRHLPPVLRALERRRLRARLLDTGRFPLRGTLDLVLGGRGPSRLRVAGGPASFRAEEVAAVWWRRPRPFEPDPRMPLRHREFAFRETSEAFAGLFRCLGARWVNDPAREAEAGHKPWQLELARACGLTVPATCITNDPSRARAFLRRVGRAGAVYKSLDAAPGTWRETRPVGPEERRLLGLVRQAPVIFQERVPGVDLRVTCFGERLFAAEIDPGEAGYRDDFRIAWPRARVRPARLPREVAAGLRRLLRRLGLLYAAADLRRTPEGEVHFLEVNPSGQFRFVEERTGQPMTEALCDLLAGR